jgi:hypothetical protein
MTDFKQQLREHMEPSEVVQDFWDSLRDFAADDDFTRQAAIGFAPDEEVLKEFDHWYGIYSEGDRGLPLLEAIHPVLLDDYHKKFPVA